MNPAPRPNPEPSNHDNDDQPAPAVPETAQSAGAAGWLRRRGDDIDMAATHGWRCAAGWIKATTIILTTLIAFLTIGWITTTVVGWAHALPWPLPTARDHTGLLATIDHPVHRYLAAHTRHLPLSATAAYSTWQAVGVVSLILGFLRSSGARLAWTLWGAATVAAVWSASPADGREVAAGIALLAWSALSVFALRGLSFSPAAFIQVDVHNQTPPAPAASTQIHLPKQATTGYQPYTPQQPPHAN